MARRSGFERAHLIRYGRHIDRRRAGRPRSRPAANPRSRACRLAYPCSTFTPSAPAEARSPASTQPARCASGRNPPAPIPAPSATVAARSPPSPMRTCFSDACSQHRFLGGDFQLDLERTRRIVAEWLRQQRSKLSLGKVCRRSDSRGQLHHGKSHSCGVHRARLRSARLYAGSVRRCRRPACLRTCLCPGHSRA